MKRAFVAAIVCLFWASGLLAQPASELQLRVPVPPTPVFSAGKNVLAYELHVENAGSREIKLNRVEARDEQERALLTFSGNAVPANWKLLGERGEQPKKITPGVTAVIYMWIALDPAAPLPHTLSHIVEFSSRTGSATSRGAEISVLPASTLVLAPPVRGDNWWVALGPSNTSEHRRAVLRVGDDNTPHLAQRFAIDWTRLDEKGNYARGKGRKNEDWFGYGTDALAVSDAVVAEVKDGVPENTPGQNSRSVKMTIDTVMGNYVVLRLADGEYACYVHLQPGSLNVKPGDHVHAGDVLGKVGNSGNSDGPHLHFQVVTAADGNTAPLKGEGVPYLLDDYLVTQHDPDVVKSKANLSKLGKHSRELPAEGDVVALGAAKQ